MGYKNIPSSVLKTKEIRKKQNITVPPISQIKRLTHRELETMEKYFHAILEDRFGPEIWAVIETLEHINHYQREKKHHDRV